ncbi:ComF family protein [Ectothiorhodospira haloalkaliphila]|uniref:ComF family protein n=2 Tax=Ectothiorhodospira haloalkaliphila TaxID=421628 RepID=UPI00047DBF8C|nr:ComF family protein [Ectothiorhodospira haloalkaliphila]
MNRLISEVRRLGAAWMARAYPPVCLLCGAAGDDGLDLCRPCAAELPRPGHVCPRCGLSLGSDSAHPCGHCLTHPPDFDHAWAALSYLWPVDDLVGRFKFHGRLNHGRLLGKLMARELAPRVTRPDCVIPVPLHPHRIRERGFNQAVELARPLCRALDCPLEAFAVHRVRATPPQQTLSAKHRQRNLRGAFHVAEGFAPAHVALVDDVMTTGSTLDELAGLLKTRGVQRVDVWVLARVPDPARAHPEPDNPWQSRQTPPPRTSCCSKRP